MKSRTMALAMVSALALAACGHRNNADSGAGSDATTTNTAAVDNMTTDNGMSDAAANSAMPAANSAMPTANSGQSFANMAAASDAFEIQTSKLALTKAQSAGVKKFAQQMITAHTGSTAKLKTLAAGLTPPITPDPTLNAEQQAKVAELQGKSGADFDQTYIADQTAGHQQTLDVLKGYATTGDVPQLKTFASGMVPIVTAHLNMAQGLKH